MSGSARTARPRHRDPHEITRDELAPTLLKAGAMTHSKAVLALIVLAACPGPKHDDKPDGPPPPPPDEVLPGANVVTVNLGVTPDLIAYRDGAGAWQTPVASSTGVYTLNVTDAYTLVAVCSDP